MRSFLRGIGLVGVISVVGCAHAETRFSVRYPASAFSGPFSGKVVVYVSAKSSPGEPRFGPNWFAPQPCLSSEFSNIAPGQKMVLDRSNVVSFPRDLDSIKAGYYMVQAVLDRNLGGRTIGSSPGNLYSPPTLAHIGGTNDSTLDLVCSSVVPAEHFNDTKTIKAEMVQSKLLSEFYHRPTFVKAAVILPNEWFSGGDRKFPVLYEIPGFSGGYMNYSGRSDNDSTNIGGIPFIVVILDPNVPTGHSVFANSANNGPWGDALTTEFIPALEKRFRAIGTPNARFVSGHSSGGWSSLWLQIAYPDLFGGVWSTSPDPVDFHLFQLVDIYKPGVNMFYNADGSPVPLARLDGKPAIFYKMFSDMERPIRGEQLGSFEAVFSPKGKDGHPLKLWNRESGAVDPNVAEAWKKYDISLKLQSEWQTLAPMLKGKLHVYCGDVDTFYLDGAVRRLQKQMSALGSDAVIEIVPGDHSSMMTEELRSRINREMADKFRSADRHEISKVASG